MGLIKASQLPNPDKVTDGLVDATLPLSDSDILLCFQNGSWKKVAKSAIGGGGGSSYLSAEVELANADIIALPTTPFEIIAAPGAGKQIFPFAYIVRTNTVAGAYSNFDPSPDSIIAIGWGNSGGSTIADAMTYMQAQNTIGIAHRQYLSGGIIASSNVNASWGLIAGGANETSIPLTNLPLTLIAYNSAGNFSGGNAANTLKVRVFYTLEDV